MTWWQGMVLGVVQGLTEFLPVSSSGHLVVVEHIFGVRSPGVVLEVVLHLATLLAVAVVYWRRVAALIGGAVAGQPAAWRAIGLLALASLPAVFVGLFLKDVVAQAFDSLAFVGVGFVVTGTMLWGARKRSGAREEPSAVASLLIGLAQSLAIFPGISRSGATITVGIWTGVRPVLAAEFSFLMALAAVGGAALVQLPALATVGPRIGWWPLGLSFLTALVSGVAAIRFLIALLQRGSLHRFAPYCWALGVVTLGWVVIG